MSHFLDRLTYFSQPRETFAQGHGQTNGEDRTWEDAYRDRWAHDKIVRSTHGVNCTGSCSWKIYVKGGIVTWETQQTDYPRTRPDLPNHEPRGCARGASYSWYLYSANRVKYPMVRGRLLKHWRAALLLAKSPVDAWANIVENESAKREWQKQRGLGGFVRSTWDEVNQMIAAANVYTIKKHGPDRIIGFSPIPAMSMISYAAGSRYLSLIGGVCMSFYDWYCDLPPSSPQVWGEQTDVPESADWYNSSFIIAWGSNVPQTRTPDAHFLTEVRYKGTKVVSITPDYSEVAKLGDLWMHPKQGTDAAVAMAMGHVILKEFYFKDGGKGRSTYFDDYARRYTDLPLLVVLKEKTLPDGRTVMVPDRYVRASDFPGQLDQSNNPDWKTVGYDELGQVTLPNGSIGFRWGADGRADEGLWNLENKEARTGNTVKLKLSVIEDGEQAYDVADVAFPYFGGVQTPNFTANEQGGDVMVRRVPVSHLELAGHEAQGRVMVATVFDLLAGNYGIDRGLPGEEPGGSYDADRPYTPAWQESITGVPREQIIAVARQFADNADKTHGKSMVIIGAAIGQRLFLEHHQQWQVGVAARVVVKVRAAALATVLEVELFQDHMAHGHGHGRIGALLGVHPQVTQLGHFGIVGRDGHDLGALVAHLGQEVGVGRARLRHVGAPGNDVRAVVPVGGLGHVGLLAPSLWAAGGQVAVPVVEAHAHAANLAQVARTGCVRNHRHRGDGREADDAVGAMLLDRVHIGCSDHLVDFVPGAAHEAAQAALLLPFALGGVVLDDARPGVHRALGQQQRRAPVLEQAATHHGVLHAVGAVQVPAVAGAPGAAAGLVVGQVGPCAGVVGLLGFPGDDPALDVNLPRAAARAVHAVGAAHDLVVRPAVAVGVFPGAVFTVGFAVALREGLAWLREVGKAVEKVTHRGSPK